VRILRRNLASTSSSGWAVSATAVLVALGIGCGNNAGETPVSPAEEAPGNGGVTEYVSFADTSLEAAVREALKRPTGRLSEEDLLSLVTLTATEAGIVDLAGLGQLKNLESLDLSGNQIADASPLRQLTRLSFYR